MTVGELIRELERVDPTYQAVVVVQVSAPTDAGHIEHEAAAREIDVMVERHDPPRNGVAFIIGAEES